MGLDISWYRGARIAPEAEIEDGSPVDWENYVMLREQKEYEAYWPGRMAGINPGVYGFEEDGGFRAGSYGGYNQWRDDLAVLAGYGSAEKAWAEGEAGRTEGPFWELINFSDCEGVIGPIVSAKLAQDFTEYQDKVDPAANEWFAEKYADWRNAFEQARHGGFVEFH